MRKRKQLETVLETSIASTQQTIEQALIENLGIQLDIESSYNGLAGMNNIGIFTHKLKNHKNIFAISKLQKTAGARREYTFQCWQKNNLDNMLAAKAFLLGSFRNEHYSWVTSEALHIPKSFPDSGIRSLFDRLNVPDEKLTKLSIDGRLESLRTALEGNTKIKSILVSLVCQLETEDAKQFTIEFFQERKMLLECSSGLYDNINELIHMYFSHIFEDDISFMYGLIHGDFKKQNILADKQSNLKVIDLQYFTYGVRIWDLAFYYSKDKREFSIIYSLLLRSFTWTKIERETFIIFYLIASSLHLKAKNAEDISHRKLEPAVRCFFNSLKETDLHNKLPCSKPQGIK